MSRIPLSALIGLVLTAAFFLTAIFANLLAPYGLNETIGDVWENPFWSAEPSQYLLGTDNIGRDLLSRMIYGCQITIFLATAADSLRRGR